MTLEFPSGHRAAVAFDGPMTSAADGVAALRIRTGRPALVVIGGAETLDPASEPRLRRLFELGLVPAAARTDAAIIDGGTASGVMAVIGRAVAVADSSLDLIGVAPAGKVDPTTAQATPPLTSLEPNHTHFLLADAQDWGEETSLMFDALDAITAGQPAAIVLAGGGHVALEEVANSAIRRLPVIALAGTGGLADLLASGRTTNPSPVDVDRARLREIEATVEVIPLRLNADPAELAATLERLLRGDETLRDAVRTQFGLSAAAQREQNNYRLVQVVILILGVTLTTFAVSDAVLGGSGLLAALPWLNAALHNVILIIPIVITTLVAAAGRLRPGTRWVLLRGTSESVKREVFEYRARAGIYSRARTRRVTRAEKLAQSVGAAVNALMRTDVNMVALGLGPGNSGRSDRSRPLAREPSPHDLTTLSAHDYVGLRIEAQMSWYQLKAERLGRNIRALHWLSLGFGAVGTYLAAAGQEAFVAITTAVAAAYTTYREAWQLETTLVLYNQAGANLASIHSWWSALPVRRQQQQETVDRLVESTERVLRAEQTGWVQEMQDAMARLRLEPDDRDGGGPEDDDQYRGG